MIAEKLLRRHNAAEMNKQEKSLSITVSDDEKFVARVIAKAKGIKPATAARQLYYRGLEGFLRDGELRGSRLEEEIRRDLEKMVGADATLARAAEVVRSEEEQKKTAGQPPAGPREIVGTAPQSRVSAGRRSRKGR
jgi:hypothetical protein